MKEIKFRVWTGAEMEYNIMAGFLGAFYVAGINEDDSACMSTFNTIYSKETPVMQYTGLHDKNGKDIYEGDVVKVFSHNRGCEECDLIDSGERTEHREECENYLCTQIIKWDCGYFCDEETGDYCPPLSNDELELEIIGNIYSNPELLQ